MEWSIHEKKHSSLEFGLICQCTKIVSSQCLNSKAYQRKKIERIRGVSFIIDNFEVEYNNYNDLSVESRLPIESVVPPMLFYTSPMSHQCA